MLALPTNMADLAFMSQVASAQQAPPKRRRDEKQGAPNLEKQVGTLTSQMRNVMTVVSQHDGHIREFYAWSCHTLLLHKESEPGKALLTAMQAWKSQMPTTGPHPLGAPRWRVAGCQSTDRLEKFQAYHQALSNVSDKEQPVQLAVAKETRDHKVLLKIQPALLRQSEWTEACDVLRVIVVKEGGEVKTVVAPPNPLIRQLQ